MNGLKWFNNFIKTEHKIFTKNINITNKEINNNIIEWTGNGYILNTGMIGVSLNGTPLTENDYLEETSNSIKYINATRPLTISDVITIEYRYIELYIDGIKIMSTLDSLQYIEPINNMIVFVKENKGIYQYINDTWELQLILGEGSVQISNEEGNIIVLKEDGIYAATSGTGEVAVDTSDKKNILFLGKDGLYAIPLLSNAEDNILTFSEGGKLYVPDVKISKNPNNAIVKYDDGLHVRKIEASSDANNVLEIKKDGTLFVPETEIKISQKSDNLLQIDATEDTGGLYAPIKVSTIENNIIQKVYDGIYATITLSNFSDNILSWDEFGRLYAPRIKLSPNEDNSLSFDENYRLYAPQIQISSDETNILTEKEDGLYVPQTQVSLSERADNILVKDADGSLYVPPHLKISLDDKNLIKDNNGIYLDIASFDISQKSDNMLTIINDDTYYGLYVPPTEFPVDPDPTNAMVYHDKIGWYVPSISASLNWLVYPSTNNAIEIRQLDDKNAIFAKKIIKSTKSDNAIELIEDDDTVSIYAKKLTLSTAKDNLASFDSNNNLYVTTKISTQTDNILQKSDDGTLYVPQQSGGDTNNGTLQIETLEINDVTPNQVITIPKKNNGFNAFDFVKVYKKIAPTETDSVVCTFNNSTDYEYDSTLITINSTGINKVETTSYVSLEYVADLENGYYLYKGVIDTTGKAAIKIL